MPLKSSISRAMKFTVAPLKDKELEARTTFAPAEKFSMTGSE
jgi:hypothetical protein